MTSNSEQNSNNNKLEQRMWSILITISLAFGGIWLQNQYATVQSLLTQLHEYQRFVDDKYVAQKQYDLNERIVDNRLTRIEVNQNSMMESIVKLEQDDVKRDAENTAQDVVNGNHRAAK